MYKDGLEVYNEIMKQSVELKNVDIHPKIVTLGNYSYYLLKDHYKREINKQFEMFRELIFIDVAGFQLEIFIHRDTIKEGVFNERKLDIKVYG